MKAMNPRVECVMWGEHVILSQSINSAPMKIMLRHFTCSSMHVENTKWKDTLTTGASFILFIHSRFTSEIGIRAQIHITEAQRHTAPMHCCAAAFRAHTKEFLIESRRLSLLLFIRFAIFVNKLHNLSEFDSVASNFDEVTREEGKERRQWNRGKEQHRTNESSSVSESVCAWRWN